MMRALVEEYGQRYEMGKECNYRDKWKVVEDDYGMRKVAEQLAKRTQKRVYKEYWDRIKRKQEE